MSRLFFYGLRGSRGIEHARVMSVWTRLFTWESGDASGYIRAETDARRFGVQLDRVVADEVRDHSSVTTHKAFLLTVREPHRISTVVDHFTSNDVLTVVYHPEWVEGTEFEFLHNGVKIDEARARELVG